MQLNQVSSSFNLATLSGPSRYCALQDGLHEVQALITSKTGAEARFLSLFSAASVACPEYDDSSDSVDHDPVGRSFHSGRFRRFDQLISEGLLVQLLDPARSDSIRCLEVGAGTSYGQDRHHGSPWLSRSLAMTFSELGSFMATDIVSSHELHWFFVDAEGRLSSRPLRSIQFEAGIPLSSLSSTEHGPIFLPVDTAELLYFLGPRAAFFNHEISRALGSDNFYDGNLFLRPALDSEFERILFKLETKTSVNFMNLSGLGSFDYIFARHQAPFPIAVEPERLSGLCRAIKGALKPRGIGFVEFGESDIFSPTPLIVAGPELSLEYPRMNIGIEAFVRLIHKGRGF